MSNASANASGAANSETAKVLTSFGEISDYSDFRTYVKLKAWYDNPDLWQIYWDEFVRDYLQPNREFESHNNSNLHSLVKFNRIFHLLTDGHVRDYLEEMPIKAEWDKEDHLCRILHRVFDANVRLDHGVLHDIVVRNYDISEHRLPLQSIWEVVLDKRAQWKCKHPNNLPSKRSGGLKSMTKDAVNKKRKRMPTGPNSSGGQIDITWQQLGPKDPKCKRFNNLNQKSCNMLMDEIAARFELDAVQVKNTVIFICEDYDNLEARFRKPLKDVTAVELRDETPRLCSSRWVEIQARAKRSTKPMLAILFSDLQADNHADNTNGGARDSAEGRARRRHNLCDEDIGADEEDDDEVKQERIPDNTENGIAALGALDPAEKSDPAGSLICAETSDQTEILHGSGPPEQVDTLPAPMEVQVGHASTAVLGLPGEEVQECGQGLPDEHEADPEDDVARRGPAEAFDLRQDVRDED